MLIVSELSEALEADRKEGISKKQPLLGLSCTQIEKPMTMLIRSI